MLECIFLAGLPNVVSQLLRATYRTDELSVDQLLQHDSGSTETAEVLSL